MVHPLYGSVHLRELCPVEVPLAVYTNLGGPVAPCTLGVRFQKLTCQFTNTWGALWRKRHFCTSVVWLCTAPGPVHHSSATSCVHKSGSRCTIPKMLMPFHKPMGSTLVQTAFSYTQLCTAPGPVHRRSAISCVHKPGRSRSALSTKCIFLKATRQFTRPLEALWRKQHFRTPAVRLCTALGPVHCRSATSCVNKSRRSRSALYTRCMILKTHMPVN